MSAETGTPRTNAEIVASYLDAVLHRDASAIDRFFHPQIEYIVNGAAVRDAGSSLLAIQIPIQLARLDPVVDRATADPKALGQLALAHPLLQIVA